MLTPETLAAAGYREHLVPPTSRAARFYQRAIRDQQGLRYYIDVYEYAPMPALRQDRSYEVELVATTADGVTCATRLSWVTDLAAAEAHMSATWERLGYRRHDWRDREVG